MGVELEYQWGGIYRLITRWEVPDIGFEEETIYANIERYALMKIATRPEIFPCSEVIGWILPREDVTTMILENVDKQGYATYSTGLPLTRSTSILDWRLAEGHHDGPSRDTEKDAHA